jgi:hypothetical protein
MPERDAEMARSVNRHFHFEEANVRTEDQMWAEVQRVWNELDQAMIERLVLRLKRRCELCKMCRGKTIS